MIIHFRFNDSDCTADLSRPIDLSMPLTTGSDGVQAFYLPPMELEPFRAGTFVGDVAQGGAGRLLHDVPQLAGKNNVLVSAWKQGRFYEKHIAASLRPGQRRPREWRL